MSKRIIVPCYDPYPGPEWEAIFQHASDVWACVLNVNSGIGTLDDYTTYLAMSNRLRDAGILRLGYVSTRYGARPIEEVQAEIALWFSRYKVDGVFADEQAFGADLLPYYRRVKGAVANGIFVTNPGAIPDAAYADLDAIICVAETDQQTYLARQFPAWTKNKTVVHIVYGVTDAAKVLAKIDANEARYLYITTTVPKPGASGPEFTIPDTIWPNLAPWSIPTVPEPSEQPATARMLSTCTDQQLLEEVGRRLAR